MRVLGTVATPPVASPGGVVSLRVVTADVESHPLAVAWHRCADTLYTVTGTPDAGSTSSLAAQVLTANVAACLRTPSFAQGTIVQVPIDAEGGRREAMPVRPPRRWTDLVGFACAGGDIEPPPSSGTWPRCTGAQGVVFTASIPGPMDSGDNPPSAPFTVTDLAFGPTPEAALPWVEGVVPTMVRCANGRAGCTPWVLRFRVPEASAVVESTGSGAGVPGVVVDGVVYATYHVTDAAGLPSTQCSGADTEAVLQTRGGVTTTRWYPPASAGDVTFWLTLRRATGGLTVLRRSVRVQ